MESEETAQERMNRWHDEQSRKKRESLYAAYMERVRVYAEARARGMWPDGFTPA